MLESLIQTEVSAECNESCLDATKVCGTAPVVEEVEVVRLSVLLPLPVPPPTPNMFPPPPMLLLSKKQQIEIIEWWFSTSTKICTMDNIMIN